MNRQERLHGPRQKCALYQQLKPLFIHLFRHTYSPDKRRRAIKRSERPDSVRGKGTAAIIPKSHGIGEQCRAELFKPVNGYEDHQLDQFTRGCNLERH